MAGQKKTTVRRAYGRYVTTVERVEEIDQGHRVVYTVLGGIPVRAYKVYAAWIGEKAARMALEAAIS